MSKNKYNDYLGCIAPVNGTKQESSPIQLTMTDYDHMEGICTKYPQFSKNQLRWLVANKERYGIAHAIKRIGRRLYFHIPSFILWVSEQNA